MASRILVLLLALSVALAPSALAQADHEHDMSKGMLFVTHDLQPDGYALVGDISHFGFLLLGKDGLPSRHHNAKVTIVQNGVTLYETISAHDYDGVNNVEIIFPVPGPYQVIAEVPTSDGLLVSYFNGTAFEAASTVAAKLKIEKIPTSAYAGSLAEFAYHIVDASDAILAHTDVNVDIRKVDEDLLVFRTHTHTHAKSQSFGYVFEEPGEYTVRLVGYNAFPTPEAPAFEAFSQEVRVMVEAPAIRTDERPITTVPESDETESAAEPGHGHEGGPKHKLFATYDPDTKGGSFGAMRLSAVVFDPELMETVQHVNYQASLIDPAGRVLFESSSLHEYDGVLEMMTLNRAPGEYRLEVSAARGDWKDHATFKWQILPPNPALIAAAGALGAANGSPVSVNSGPVFLELMGADKLVSGAPQALEFFAHHAGGLPFQHSEVDFQFFTADGSAPILAHKVHTHADGKFLINVTFPEGGDHNLQADSISIHGDATPIYFGKDVNSPRLLHLKVAAGTPLPTPGGDVVPLTEGGEPARVPGFEVVFLAAAVALVAIMRKRN